MAASERGPVDVSAVIPAREEAATIGSLLECVRTALAEAGWAHEVIVVDAGSSDGTAERAREAGARIILQRGRGYGAALCEGFRACRGRRILTLDADGSHDPRSGVALLRALDRFDVAIGSRYVPGARAEMPAFRLLLSRILNAVFGRFLRLPFRDLSSGFRAYRREAVAGRAFVGRQFEVLPEILLAAHVEGRCIGELPIHYRPRAAGRSKARLAVQGAAYLRGLVRMAQIRRRGAAGGGGER